MDLEISTRVIPDPERFRVFVRESDGKKKLVYTGRLLNDTTHTLGLETLEVPTPQNLNALGFENHIDISWDRVEHSSLAGYRVYRGSTLIATTTSTSYRDEDVLAGTTYTYYVIAFNAYGDTSSPSNSDDASIGLEFPSPENLTLATTETPSVELNWDSPANKTPDHYRIYKYGTFITTVASGTTAYSDTNVKVDIEYCYSVSAVYDTEESDKTSQACATPTIFYPEDEFYAFGSGADDTVRKAQLDSTVLWSKAHNGSDEAKCSLDADRQGNLLVADADGVLTKYDSEGNELWLVSTTYSSLMAWFAHDGQVLAIGENDYFFTLDEDGNSISSAIDLTSITSYTSVNDYLVRNGVMTENKNFFFWNGSKSDLVKVSFSLSSATIYSSGMSSNAGQGVIAGDEDGFLYVASYATLGKMDREGNLEWTNNLNSKVTSCAYRDGVVYAGTDDSSLYALDKTGTVIDSFTGTELTNARTVHIIVSQNNEVYQGYANQNDVQQIEGISNGSFGAITTVTGVPGLDVITKGGHFLPWELM